VGGGKPDGREGAGRSRPTLTAGRPLVDVHSQEERRFRAPSPKPPGYPTSPECRIPMRHPSDSAQSLLHLREVTKRPIGMNDDFRRRFRHLRRRYGLSQTAVATSIGTTRQRISRWEKRLARLTVEELQSLHNLYVKLEQKEASKCCKAKVCWDCSKLRPLEEFNRDRSRRDGRQSRCAVCSTRHSRRIRSRKIRRKPRASLVHSVCFGRSSTSRDYDELAQLGDGMHLTERRLVTFSGDDIQLLEVRFPELVQQGRAAVAAGKTREQVLEEIKRRVDFQQALSALEKPWTASARRSLEDIH